MLKVRDKDNSMVKNQHYVPQFYLHHFLNKQGNFWAFHKDSKKIFATNPKSVANENFFYDLSELEVQTQIKQPVEKYLSEFETLHAPALDHILKSIDSHKLTTIDTVMRDLLCDFLVIQSIRTKEQRAEMLQSSTQFKNFLMQSGLFVASQLENLDTEESIKKQHLDLLLFDTEFKNRLINILSKHIWMIFKNTSNLPYYTSDHPLVRRPHVIRQERSDTGFGSKGIEIAIPLSPTHLLVLVERTHFRHYEQYENEVLLMNDTANVTYYNSLQVLQSYRTILCCDNQFDLAVEMINTNPDLGNLNRERLGPA